MCLSINGPLTPPHDSDFILERPIMSPITTSIEVGPNYKKYTTTAAVSRDKKQFWTYLQHTADDPVLIKPAKRASLRKKLKPVVQADGPPAPATEEGDMTRTE